MKVNDNRYQVWNHKEASSRKDHIFKSLQYLFSVGNVVGINPISGSFVNGSQNLKIR